MMKVKRVGIILVTIVLLASSTITFSASKNIAPIGNLTPAAIGQSIANTFTDQKLAKVIADKVAYGNVGATFTQTMANSITYLDAKSKDIVDLSGLELLTNLTSLDLRWNKIVEIPDSIFSLPNLDGFEISFNQIEVIPDSIGNAPKLRIFGASGNQLTTLPETLVNISTLEHLILTNNKISSLPENIGDIPNLLGLELRFNQLTMIPDSVGNYQHLYGLGIGFNKLTALPDSIGNIESLLRLTADGNMLSDLPDTFANLPNLHDLWINDNRFIELPSVVTDIIPLESLRVEDNQLTSLPIEINKLVNLKSFYLRGNLLPSNYYETLNTLGFGFTVNNELQRSVQIKVGILPFTIMSETDISSINLLSLIELSDGTSVNGNHNLIFEDFVDAVGLPVLVSDYIQNNEVLKAGTVSVKIRVEGKGLFPNASDNAITVNQINLVFRKDIDHYEVNFDFNGGTGDALPPLEYVEGDCIFAPEIDPTRNNYVFTGWYTTRDAIIQNKWDFDEMTMPNHRLTLYAGWAVVPINSFILSFDLNGGTGITPLSQTLEVGKNAVEPATPIREGYTFKGWNTKVDETGANWNFGVDVMPSNNITLYATWAKVDPIRTYTLSFNLNGGEGSIASQTLKAGEPTTQPATPIREGYTFKGWNTKVDGTGTVWDFNTMTMSAHDTTLNAIWKVDKVLPDTGLESSIGISVALVAIGSLLALKRKKIR